MIPLTKAKKEKLLKNLELCRTGHLPPMSETCDCEDCVNYWRPDSELDSGLDEVNQLEGVATMTSRYGIVPPDACDSFQRHPKQSYLQVAVSRTVWDRLYVIQDALLSDPPDDDGEVYILFQSGDQPDEAFEVFFNSGIEMIDHPEEYTKVDRVFFFFLAEEPESHDWFFKSLKKILEEAAD